MENSNINYYNEIFIPRRLVLQWHITERCNLHCKHCYQDSEHLPDELTYSQLLQVLQQYLDMLAKWNKILQQDGQNLARKPTQHTINIKQPLIQNHQITASQSPQRIKQKITNHGRKILGHINITGGEPFIRQDFWQILEIFHQHHRHLSYGILTNGTMLNQNAIQKLQTLQPSFIQVSVEGTEKTHDSIRGKGNFAETVEVIKSLVQAKFYVLIAFTAHRQNFREFSDVVNLGAKLHVGRVWADRLIPCGGATTMQDMVLTPAETQEFCQIMQSAKTRLTNTWWGKIARWGQQLCTKVSSQRVCAEVSSQRVYTEVSLQRALQFLSGGYPYHCQAGNELITIQTNGDIVPCRRMPIVLDNIFKTPLDKVYQEHSLLQKLRSHPVSPSCIQCLYASVCQGGLKCLAYAMTQDPWAGDPGCWLLHPTEF